MSETSLSLPELTSCSQDLKFFMRLGWLGIGIENGTEAGFSVRKFPSSIQYSEVLMPETAEENAGFDPTKELAINKIIRSGRQVDQYLAAFFHSHPGRPEYSHQAYTNYPSRADLDIFANTIYPVHPGHIGGIVTANRGPVYTMNVLLYRASDETQAPWI